MSLGAWSTLAKEREGVVERACNHELESCNHYQQQQNYYKDILKKINI